MADNQKWSESALKYNRRYQAEYRKNNADKVKEWRKNAIVNAYLKLIEAEPERAVKSE